MNKIRPDIGLIPKHFWLYQEMQGFDDPNSPLFAKYKYKLTAGPFPAAEFDIPDPVHIVAKTIAMYKTTALLGTDDSPIFNIPRKIGFRDLFMFTYHNSKETGLYVVIDPTKITIPDKSVAIKLIGVKAHAMIMYPSNVFEDATQWSGNK